MIKNYNKIIHQIWWQGENNIPNKYKTFRKKWIYTHNSWKFILWDKSLFEKLLQKLNNKFYNYIYLNLPYMIQKIDFCKYIIIYLYGGIYIDIDTVPEKKLDDLIYKINKDLILCKLELNFLSYKYILINNGIIMSIKYNNFFNYLFYLIYKNIKSKFYYPKDWYILESTGPIVFTKAMIMYLNNTKTNNYKILNSSYFESCETNKWGNKNICTKGLYITHIHDCSWCSYKFKFILKHKFKIQIILILIIYFIVKKYIF